MDTASPSNVTQQQMTSREMICQEAETRALFAALDKDRNGFIDKNELRATMSEVGLQLSDDDIDTMMKAAGVVIKDRIFYEDFLRMMTGKIGLSHRKAASKATSRDSRDPSLYSLCDDEHNEDDDVQAMRVAFAMCDRDADGLISIQEVHDTMTSLGHKVSHKQVKQIVRRVDTDRDGSISFDEFRELMTRYEQTAAAAAAVAKQQTARHSHQSSDAPCERRVVADSPLHTARSPAATAAWRHDVAVDVDDELRDAFQVFDKDKDGFLSATDLRSTMSQLGMVLSEDDVHAMMKSVGIGPYGKISYSDFRRIYTSKTSNATQICLNDFQTNNKLTKKQETELRAVFSVFDVDRDGFITVEEVFKVLESMGFLPSPASIDDIFRQVDLDGNGKIDFREFLLLVYNYERPLPEDVEVREMFNALDKDKNGYIDRAELKTSFAGLGITLTDDDVAEMMAEADVYADRIYFEDFVYMMRGKLNVTPSHVRLSRANSSSAASSSTDTSQHHQHTLSGDSELMAHQQRVAAVAQARRRQRVVVASNNNNDDNNNSSSVASRRRGTTEVGNDARRRSRPVVQGGLSFEVQEFFSETTSSVDVVVAESPTSPVTVRQLSCPPGANHAQTTPTATPTAAADGGDGNDDDDESASHKRTTSSSSSSSPAPSTWIAFKVFDHNSDGYISKLELHKTMNDLGIELSREDLDAMMDEADVNKDGRIDYAGTSRQLHVVLVPPAILLNEILTRLYSESANLRQGV